MTSSSQSHRGCRCQAARALRLYGGPFLDGVYIAGTPSAEVQARVVPIVRAALASPTYAQALAVGSLEAASSTPQELDRLARADLERWGPIVKASGFEAEN